MAGWATYIAASAALLAMLSPTLSGVSAGAAAGSSARTLDGVAAVLDGLRPGLSVNFSFGSPQSCGAVSLHGDSLTCAPSAVTANVSLPLSAATLAPGVEYTASLMNGEVVVIPVG
jgi:hypothetical protein